MVSKLIVDNIESNKFGLATSLKENARAIANNIKEILPVVTPKGFKKIPEGTTRGVPVQLRLDNKSLYDDQSKKSNFIIKGHPRNRCFKPSSDIEIGHSANKRNIDRRTECLSNQLKHRGVKKELKQQTTTFATAAFLL
jgi:hypothetical protein